MLYHVVARCAGRDFQFKEDDDFIRYLRVLKLFLHKHRFVLFNYTVLPFRVHLFLKPSSTIPLARTMQQINWVFARDYNRRRERRGSFWWGRYTSIPVESGPSSLLLMRHINMDPVRTGLVKSPEQWRWSGYHFYAFGEPNELLIPHPNYLLLRSDSTSRQERYERFVRGVEELEL